MKMAFWTSNNYSSRELVRIDVFGISRPLERKTPPEKEGARRGYNVYITRKSRMQASFVVTFNPSISSIPSDQTVPVLLFMSPYPLRSISTLTYVKKNPTSP